MNYSTDRPINTIEQDLLGRSTFSNQLGKAVYEYKGIDGLVIGIFGKWGSGKTSVINMMIQEINKLAEHDDNKPMIMKFAPWNYSDKDNLISLFFQNLKHKINIQDNEDLKNKVGKALNDYSGVFDALSLVPVVGSGAAAVLKTLAQAQGTNMMQCADLDRTREILEQELIKAKKKFIIVIDDIDRLTNSQIRDVFQLVKQVADFPNVIYVLSMDREVVRNALKEVHNIDGNEYLEKIVQIPFELPELSKSKLHAIFFTKLNQVINDLSGEVVWDKEHWSNVFRNCIEPYINTLRDINRLINVFQFKYDVLYQETAFEDMVGITALEVLEPKLYKWIGNNKDAVCGGFMHGFLSSSHNKPDYRKLYHDEFESLGINPDLAISCISSMFPVFAEDVKEYQYCYRLRSDIRGKMRVAHQERFELYFMFGLDDIKVSRNIIHACIYEYDRNRLIMTIKEINRQENIVYFLKEIGSLVDCIPNERLNLIASVLLDLQAGFKGEESRDILIMPASDIADKVIADIIKRLDTEEEKYKIIYSAVKKVNKDGLGIIARIIYRIELAYGRIGGDSENKDRQIISLKHLKELEEIYKTRIHVIAKSESILDINEFWLVLNLWEYFDQDCVKDYLKELFKDDVNTLKFICAMASKWNSTNCSGWDFYPEVYSKYISQDEVYNVINCFAKNNLDKFTNVEQIKIASFAMNYKNSKMDHVNEQEALDFVNEWKAEKEK